MVEKSTKGRNYHADFKPFYNSVHIFACIDTFKEEFKLTSEFLAASINVNPVIIRKILSQLKAAGLVKVQRGSGGASIAKPLDEITFFDIYQAVECVEHGELFHFHENPNQKCRLEEIFTMFWTENLYRYKMPWRMSLVKLH